ncbi:GNAT family N-acetyltransferase [Streptomyces sp. NPDC002795]|uniref:GNAT family N-acetyltransferase n=1 Tax=Streptomyces sp. NPDC002795 TaxID=3364665 RepID=UPI00369ECC48
MTSATPPVVEHRPDEQRYVITVDREQAGFTEYRDRDEQRVFFHTEVDDRFAGQGLASILVTEALADVRADGKRVVPVCPYWAKYVKKREEETADVVDPVRPEVLAWLRSRLD